jgi:hypothetical protein
MVQGWRDRQGFLPGTDPAQRVADNCYLFLRMVHKNDAYLAGDTTKE